MTGALRKGDIWTQTQGRSRTKMQAEIRAPRNVMTAGKLRPPAESPGRTNPEGTLTSELRDHPFLLWGPPGWRSFVVTAPASQDLDLYLLHTCSKEPSPLTRMAHESSSSAPGLPIAPPTPPSVSEGIWPNTREGSPGK